MRDDSGCSAVTVPGAAVVEVVVARPTVKGGDMSPVVQGSVDDACEEPLCPR